MKCKIIYNPSIARQLLHMGNNIVDIKTILMNGIKKWKNTG